jgi:hypothetical protein
MRNSRSLSSAFPSKPAQHRCMTRKTISIKVGVAHWLDQTVYLAMACQEMIWTLFSLPFQKENQFVEPAKTHFVTNPCHHIHCSLLP